jgi:hypothetical protein
MIKPHNLKNQAIFKVYEQDDKYSLCASYPKVLIFPHSASDTTIKGSASLRSSNRLPTLTWYDK